MIGRRSLLISPLALLPSLAISQQGSTIQLQAIQSREFDCSLKVAFTAVLSVFQDLGYSINTANFEIGLITAKSLTTTAFESLARYSKDERATAFIEPSAPGRIKIRLSIVRSRRALGRGEEETAVTEPETYQAAFAKIQNAIFVRSNLGSN